MEETDGVVTVTWGLGEPASGPVEYFGYAVNYHGPDGNGGKRFGVRFHEKVTAYVFDYVSATQANYTDHAVEIGDDRIVVTYNDATIGMPEIGTIAAFSHSSDEELQLDLPVALLR